MLQLEDLLHLDPDVCVQSGAKETLYVSLYCELDEITCMCRIGVHSMSFEKLVSEVPTLMQDDGKRAELGKNAKKYVIENHFPDRVAEAYNKISTRPPIEHRAFRS